MSRWWRAYDEAVDDPKLLLLSDRAHRAWFNLMCLASINGGTFPDRKVIEIKLRLAPAKTQAVLNELIAAGLIDQEGETLQPHNWKGRQYKSDVSTERVQRFRNGQRNVSVTPPENRVQNTEAETEVEPSLLPSPIESKNLSIGEAKREVTPPRHCAQNREKTRVYIEKGTPEWLAYAADYRATTGEEPNVNSNGGKWFKTQGQAVPDGLDISTYLRRA